MTYIDFVRLICTGISLLIIVLLLFEVLCVRERSNFSFNESGKITEVLQRICELFAIKADGWDCSVEQHLVIRKNRTVPPMQSLFDWKLGDAICCLGKLICFLSKYQDSSGGPLMGK